jgi:4'-phosphopantetheinyl transferase
LTLSCDTVHVWRANLDRAIDYLPQVQQSLSECECRRAEKFCFEYDRQYFIVARGILRAILARYLHIEAHTLQFRYGPQGKPFLVHNQMVSPIQFNLAHSQRFALYAIAHTRDVGVDLEQVRFLPNAKQLAQQFFSNYERTTLGSIPNDQIQRAFYNCWTRKEAYIKALGIGLSQSLREFDVTLAPGDPAKLLAHRTKPNDVARWSLCELFPSKDYTAALAVEGHNYQLQCWDWDKTL